MTYRVKASRAAQADTQQPTQMTRQQLASRILPDSYYSDYYSKPEHAAAYQAYREEMKPRGVSQ